MHSHISNQILQLPPICLISLKLVTAAEKKVSIEDKFKRMVNEPAVFPLGEPFLPSTNYIG